MGDVKELSAKLLGFLPDKLYLQLYYFAKFKRPCNFKDPKTLNEKLQLLKLCDRNPLYSELVDKYEVRKHIAAIVGEEHLIPLVGGPWESFDAIDFDALPQRFVLKCTHDSGSVVVCQDKNKLDWAAARKKIEKGLKQKYYLIAREWPYKNVQPRIICEEYITDNPETDSITDYKFYCFGGEVDSVMVCTERETGAPKFYFFDQKWELKRYNKRGKEAPEGFTLPKPENMDEMFSMAKRLAKYCKAPFVRIDLYSSENQIYFGEFTFFPNGGFDANRLPETDLYFGEKVIIHTR